MVAQHGRRLNAIDISNPTSPILSGSLYQKHSLNQASAVAIVNDRAYVTTLNDYLTIINVADPSAMAVVGSLRDSTRLNYASIVVATASYAYVGAPWFDAVTIVDVSNSASPSVVGSVTSSSALGSVEGLFLAGSNLYVANAAGSPGLSWIVHDKSNDVRISRKKPYGTGRFGYTWDKPS